MPDYFIGLISGTSMDGIDAVLADFAGETLSLVGTLSHPYGEALRQRLRQAIDQPRATGVDDIGELHTLIGEHFRDAALRLIDTSGIEASNVTAIGSHGQTLRHRPDSAHRFTLQLGDASIIATGTGIDTVADFRSNDLALGGQGAPLVPPFHEWLFRDSEKPCAILNIGGVANLTLLPVGKQPVTGFDTGPGNTLLDAWSRLRRHRPFDENGDWAASGQVDEDLLERCLADDWFALPPPKSTGFEHFNLDWIESRLNQPLNDADVQATLAELTALTIANALRDVAAAPAVVYACGGGTKNADLMRRCQERLAPARLSTTAEAGLDPDWVEATAFAWLAKQRINGLPGNLPAVTGASREALLGAIYPA